MQNCSSEHVPEPLVKGRHRNRIRGVEPVVQATSETGRKMQTPAETTLWNALRSRQCGGMKFRRQHAVGPFILDFFCRDTNLVVEVDGSIHDSVDAQEHDALRTLHLERYGYTMIRFRNEEIMDNLSGVLERIREYTRPHPGSLRLATPLPILGEGENENGY